MPARASARARGRDTAAERTGADTPCRDGQTAPVVEHVEVLIIALFVSVLGLNALAERFSVPYPIFLVLGGLALGGIPGVPDVELEPELVLVIFLPPLLYSAAFFADLRALRQSARALTLLSIGLVLGTTCAVAVVAHEVIDMPWAAAFALGAVVSPTDPVAATAIMRRLGAPRAIVNIVEGESLVNDASALVAYKVAVAAAVTGSFSLFDATVDFVVAAAGGAALGLAIAVVVAWVRRRIDDPVTAMTMSLFTGYAAFIPADELELSGVLAVVTCGLYLGWHAPTLASPQTRLQTFAVWEMLVFLLNAILFILIGLQLPVIVDELGAVSVAEALGYSAAIIGVVVGVRLIWSFTVPYVIRMLDRRPQQRARRTDARTRLVMSWAGMRGGVSLAAALAIPATIDSGAPFPHRELILFITFGVIVFTVVGQGLTLPLLIRRLGVLDDGSEEESEELLGRMEAAQAALRWLESESEAREDTVRRVSRLYEFRYRRFSTRAGEVDDDDGIEEQSLGYQRLMHRVFEAQRLRLVELRNQGQISNAVMHRLERELDLEESRLEV